MHRILFFLLLLLCYTGISAQSGKKDTTVSTGQKNKPRLLKPDVSRVAYADLNIIRKQYKSLENAKKLYQSRLRLVTDSLLQKTEGKSMASLRGTDSLNFHKARRVKAVELYKSIVEEHEQKIQAVVRQAARERKYNRVSFVEADKRAGKEDLTKYIIQKLQ